MFCVVLRSVLSLVGGFFWKDESIGCANISGKVGGGDNRKVTNLGITRVCGPRCLGQASREKTIAGSSSLPAGLKVPYRRGQDGRGRDALSPGLRLPKVSSMQEAGIHTAACWLQDPATVVVAPGGGLRCPGSVWGWI